MLWTSGIYKCQILLITPIKDVYIKNGHTCTCNIRCICTIGPISCRTGSHNVRGKVGAAQEKLVPQVQKAAPTSSDQSAWAMKTPAAGIHHHGMVSVSASASALAGGGKP